MPYIVTTKRPGKYGPSHYADEADAFSRRAVATLEEARKMAADLGRLHIARDDPAVAPWLAAALLRLPESGGSVGPLPDGTVIEVEQIGWSDLARAAGRWAGHDDFEWAEPGKGPQTIVDAFNAREAER